MSRGLFITGTGTDVGKTFVTALIVKKLRENAINAGYYKAALSGADIVEGNLIASDAKYVCDIAGIEGDPNKLVSYIYKTAVSPHLAAELCGNSIDLKVIEEDFKKLKVRTEYITVEGSGGIICPMRMDANPIMLTDIIKTLKLNIVIVAHAGLGTINSTVLTVEYAKKCGISIKGIILNGYEKHNFLHIDNKKQIEIMTGVSVIACLEQNASDFPMDLQKLLLLYEEV